MNTRPFLVTGAAGFIGSHSVDRLLAQDYKVVGLDDLSSGRLDNLAKAKAMPGFRFVQGDVSDEKQMRSLFREYDFAGVLHLAALVSVPESFEKPAQNARVNLTATDLLARTALERGCRRIVFASSAAVYGTDAALPNRESAAPHPVSPYAAAKLASEIMLLGYAESHGLETVCFRYFNVYGSRQNPGSPYSGVLSIFDDRFKAGLPVTVYGDGEQSRDFISVQDVARANCHALSAMTVSSDRYNLCTGQGTTLNQILRVFRDAFPDVPEPRHGESRVGDIRHSIGDPSKLREVLGIEAHIPFDNGLRALIIGREPEKKSS